MDPSAFSIMMVNEGGVEMSKCRRHMTPVVKKLGPHSQATADSPFKPQALEIHCVTSAMAVS